VKRDTAYFVFDIESVADGALVSRLRYPEEKLLPAAAIARWRAELMAEQGKDFIPYTFQVPVSLVIARVAADYRLIDLVALDEAHSRPHEIVRFFWEGWRKYGRPCLVTFNGRGFDVPFLYLRSALLNVPITRKDWLGYRYQTEPHCDLAEQFTFYNVSGREGAARKFNLDFYCKAFGIPSPKAMGISGMDVSSLLAEGRHRDIAEYCLRDVVATVELHKVWEERLKGIK
jgi:hypothetical protein